MPGRTELEAELLKLEKDVSRKIETLAEQAFIRLFVRGVYLGSRMRPFFVYSRSATCWASNVIVTPAAKGSGLH
jgi:hypothetical protein